MLRHRQLLACCALVLCSVGAVAAQQAFTKPISGKLIRLEIQLPGDRAIKGVVEEGALFKIKDPALGDAVVGFAPVVQGDLVTVKVYEITKHPSGAGEVLRFREQLEIGEGAMAATSKAGRGLEVRVLGIVAPDKTKALCPAGPVTSSGGVTIQTGCCVTCGHTTSCGCAVEDTCGSCCVGGCCTI